LTALRIQASIRSHSRSGRHQVSSLDDVATERPNILVFSLRALWRLLFRLEVVGRENLASAGAPNIVVVDHVSWLDAPILFSLMETPPTFVIEPAAAKS
jgi:acyl-[acyl-carrier-protein]-phospholipid O-acyltransferase / long-chain-fatty-acid--[acyl-carrier-protein] ligase